MGLQLDWIIDQVKVRGDNFPKTIIFCNTLKEIASVVNLLLLKLGEHAYIQRAQLLLILCTRV